MTRTLLAITVALLVGLGLGLPRAAEAAPGKVLVLPLDGDADPEIRAKFWAAVQRLARKLGGKMTTGDVTFVDTATAIGCDPKEPKCAEDVRATLGVDELIYGTASKQDGKVVLTVRRVSKGKPRREATTTVEATDTSDRAEPELQPLFRESDGGTTGGGTSGSDTSGGGGTTGGGTTGGGTTGGGATGGGITGDPKDRPETPPTKQPPRRDRVLGYTAIAGGGTMLLITFALWSSAGGLEDDIASHPVEDYNDFVALRELEDQARARAWTGNALFLIGLAVGGYGGYLLYRDRKAQHTVVAPAPVPGGAGVVLRGAF